MTTRFCEPNCLSQVRVSDSGDRVVGQMLFGQKLYLFIYRNVNFNRLKAGQSELKPGAWQPWSQGTPGNHGPKYAWQSWSQGDSQDRIPTVNYLYNLFTFFS